MTKKKVLTSDQLNKITVWFQRKIESLERDAYRAFTDKIEVTHSLGLGAAPFPIVLYCMSTLDFFSAAYIGYSEQKHSKLKLNQTQRMATFLAKYLNYDESISTTALDIFRHKLVHLAEPHVSGKHATNDIRGWEIASVQAEGYHWTTKDYDAKGNKVVRFGVDNFIRDLKKGVLGRNGYLSDLTLDPKLQKNYLSFLQEIS